MVFLGMRLEWALRSPKSFVIAALAGVAATRLHGERVRAAAATGHAIGTIAIAMMMPMTFRRGQLWVYFAYGLVVGAIVGAVVGAMKPRTPEGDGDESRSRMSELGVDVLKGAALGVVVNLLLAFWTYA